MDAQTVWSCPGDGEPLLRELDLDTDRLRQALEQAEYEYRRCDELDPKALPGNIFWGRTIRVLRQLYKEAGWIPVNEQGMALLAHPKNKLMLTACSGSEGTGKENRNPTSRYSKGPAMAARVKNNQPPLTGWDQHWAPSQRPATRSEPVGPPTWCLVYFRESVKKEGYTQIWCELSLPTKLEDGGKIEDWKPRLILEPIHVDGIVEFRDLEPEAGEQIPEIDSSMNVEENASFDEEANSDDKHDEEGNQASS